MEEIVLRIAGAESSSPSRTIPSRLVSRFAGSGRLLLVSTLNRLEPAELKEKFTHGRSDCGSKLEDARVR